MVKLEVADELEARELVISITMLLGGFHLLLEDAHNLFPFY